MSIYPVPLQIWFPNPRNYQVRARELHGYRGIRELGNQHYAARLICKLERCGECGKSVKWNRAWGHHSIPWGHGTVYCNYECAYPSRRRI